MGVLKRKKSNGVVADNISPHHPEIVKLKEKWKIPKQAGNIYTLPSGVLKRIIEYRREKIKLLEALKNGEDYYIDEVMDVPDGTVYVFQTENDEGYSGYRTSDDLRWVKESDSPVRPQSTERPYKKGAQGCRVPAHVDWRNSSIPKLEKALKERLELEAIYLQRRYENKALSIDEAQKYKQFIRWQNEEQARRKYGKTIEELDKQQSSRPAIEVKKDVIVRNVERTGLYFRTWEKLIGSENPIIAHVGGVRSSKTYSICQVLAELFFSEKYRPLAILICRDTLQYLKLSAMKDILDIFKSEYSEAVDGVDYVYNKSERLITNLKNGSSVYFTGLDDSTKIRSLQFNIIFINEASRISQDDLNELRLRTSSPPVPGLMNRIILDSNPSHSGHWLEGFVKGADVDLIRSTVFDNRFVMSNTAYIKELQRLKDDDECLYEQMVLGNFTQLSGYIYQDNIALWNHPEGYPELDDPDYKVVYGLDYGASDPTVLVLLQINEKEKRIYLTQKYYKPIDTLEILLKDWYAIGVRHDIQIYADKSAKQFIADLKSRGFKVDPCPGHEVRDGIQLLKEYKLIIYNGPIAESGFGHRKSEEFDNFHNGHIVNDLQNYKRKQTRDGTILEDQYIHRFSHAPDAIRYAVWGVAKAKKKAGYGWIAVNW